MLGIDFERFICKLFNNLFFKVFFLQPKPSSFECRKFFWIPKFSLFKKPILMATNMRIRTFCE